MEKDVKQVTLQVNSISTHIDGYWLRHYAGDFLEASKSFTRPSNRFSPVTYYLVCHSIELSLKSYLFSVGFKRQERKKLNHDLIKALDLAEQNGIDTYIAVTDDEREVVLKANKLYVKKEFEYVESLETIYDPHDFDIELLSAFAQRLYDAIENPVRDSIIE